MMRKKSCMPNGNMIKDRNKGISNIRYNHLNLPTEIKFEETTNKITYLYNAAGQKLKKTVFYSESIKIVDYLDGFQYAGGELNFFPHPEGYVNVKRGGRTAPDGSQGYVFNYVFNYTDHLGNIRVSYSKDPQTSQLKILEENHTATLASFDLEILNFQSLTRPFGLKHSVYTAGRLKDFEVDSSNPEGEHVFLNKVTKTDYQYKYNGQEWQDELGLNMYAMDLRQYDPAIGRWMVLDPVIHHSMSPYNAFDNNPVFWADPSGADAESWLKDIFNRSQSGDVWTNDGSGTLTNNRTGETSECDDCEAKDGPLKGQKLVGGVNYDGTNPYIPWHMRETNTLVYLTMEESAERINELVNSLGDLKSILDQVTLAQGMLGTSTIAADEVLKYGKDIKSIIQNVKGRTLLIAVITLYLKYESANLSKTQLTLGNVATNYMINFNSNQIMYEVTVKESGYVGFDTYVLKTFYNGDGKYLGGYKRTPITTEQIK